MAQCAGDAVKSVCGWDSGTLNSSTTSKSLEWGDSSTALFDGGTSGYDEIKYTTQGAFAPAIVVIPMTYVKNVNYNAAGQMVRLELGNGDITTYAYDPKTLRLTNITTTSVSATLQNLSYTYDAVGNILTITDGVNTATQSFKYDELNRLTQAVGSYGTKTFSYDQLGNLLTKDGLTYTYPSALNARPHGVSSLSDGTAFTYDANGNMATRAKSGTTTTYSYDPENHLTKVVAGSTTQAQFAYDGDGGRTKKIAGATTIWYVGNLYEDNGSLTTKHIYLGSTEVAAVTNGTTTLYYHQDHLGGTNVTVDSAGTKKEVAEYLPFGGFARHDKYGSSSEVAWFYFTGKKLDDETGLYYYGARYYDPSLGRFITADTVVQAPDNPQTLNRYSYANNNPVNNIDPSGHSWFKKFISKWAGVFGFTGGIIKGIVTGDWETLKNQVTSFATAFVFSGGNPIAVLSSVVATSVLDTPVGRQMTNFISKQIFDDAFGMSPRIASVFGNMVSNAIVASAVYIALTPENYVGTDFNKLENRQKLKDFYKTVEGKSNGGSGAYWLSTNGGKSVWYKEGLVSSKNGWDDIWLGKITKVLSINHTAAAIQTSKGFFDSALNNDLIHFFKSGEFWGAPWTGVCQQVTFTTLVEKGGMSGWQAFNAVGHLSGWTYYATSAVYGVRADFGGVGLVNYAVDKNYNHR